MTFNAGSYPYGLGGLQNGGYRAALAQAQSGAINAAYTANVGALSNLATSYQTPTPTVEDAGIRAGEITGYRAWRLGSDGLLRGMYISTYVWRPQAIEHSPKVDDAWGAGLHAFKTVSEAKAQYGFFASPSEPVVFGEIALWGLVIEHERGFRAEYAAITRLIDVHVFLGPESGVRPWWKFWAPMRYPKIEAARERYGLPRDGSSVIPPAHQPNATTD